MTNALWKAWAELVRPLWRRPPERQVAALCCRQAGAGEEVLLITSRGSGRWIVPKGWPMAGKTAAQTALCEAWEEAGVRAARTDETPIGTYTYEKGLDSGYEVPVEVEVYRLSVEGLADSFPEAGQRRRKWVGPSEAADMVAEPELKAILRDL